MNNNNLDVTKDLVTENKFDEINMGVKTKYRPDWLDSENTIFINKLNHTTKNF